LPEASLSDLQGGSAEDCAVAMRELLRGKNGPFRDIVLLNAAAAFVIARRAGTLKEGACLAAASIDEGRAEKVLDALISASRDDTFAQPELVVDAK
jgi:anthranilate phosphoribosyltransferase